MALKFGEVTLTEPEALRDEPSLEGDQAEFGPESDPEPPFVVEEQDPSAIPSISDESFDELLPPDDELRATPHRS